MNFPKNQTSNKTFGTFFSVLFLLIAFYFLINKRDYFWYCPFFILATIVYLLRTYSERSLQPLNDGWYWIGCFLGQFSSSIILTIFFYLLLSPIAVLTKFFHRDVLRLRTQSNVESYWVKRSLDDRSYSDFFKNQF